MTASVTVISSKPAAALAWENSHRHGERGDRTGADWLLQRLKGAVVIVCFSTCAICLHIQQYFGLPLVYLNRKLYHSWQAVVKASSALLLLALNQWRAPTRVEISCDASCQGQIALTPSGRVRFDAPDRMVLTANHQIYTDWLYLWWSAYASGNHGHLVIILKDALKKIPIIGPGMMFFSFIFLSRRWETDEPELRRSLGKLSKDRVPMWLLIFPEGTNLTARSRGLSKKWAEKTGVDDLDLVLLPRSRGLQFCLSELAGTVDWMYDCTIAYDGIPPGVDSQEIWNLGNMYLGDCKAPTTHIHWRRFAISDIPREDSEAFDEWLHDRWVEKDTLLKHHQQTGKFPSSGARVRADVALGSLVELAQLLWSFLAAFIFWWAVKWAMGMLYKPTDP